MLEGNLCWLWWLYFSFSDEENGKKEGDSDEDSDDDSDDEDDDEKELQAELERIRQERAAAQAKKLQEEKELENKLRSDSALKSNPLLNTDDSSAKVILSNCANWHFDDRTYRVRAFMQLKRRWNDDVVFRNQAKDEPEHKKRFINDTIRSDFHRSFLKKFIK